MTTPLVRKLGSLHMEVTLKEDQSLAAGKPPLVVSTAVAETDDSKGPLTPLGLEGVVQGVDQGVPLDELFHVAVLTEKLCVKGCNTTSGTV